MAWWWDDNHDVHHNQVKSQSWVQRGGMRTVSLAQETLDLNVQHEVDDLVISRSQEVKWDNGPVITWSQYGNDSQGYWAWTTTATVPLPKVLCTPGNVFDVSLTIAILSDRTQPYGNYSKPEAIQVSLNGFGTVYKSDIKGPTKSGANWLTEVLLAAKAMVTSSWPIPHVVLTFNTENVGGVQGSVKIDWDAIIDVAIAVVGTKLTLRALR